MLHSNTCKHVDIWHFIYTYWERRSVFSTWSDKRCWLFIVNSSIHTVKHDSCFEQGSLHCVALDEFLSEKKIKLTFIFERKSAFSFFNFTELIWSYIGELNNLLWTYSLNLKIHKKHPQYKLLVIAKSIHAVKHDSCFEQGSLDRVG
jgi:hypothetical protein